MLVQFMMMTNTEDQQLARTSFQKEVDPRMNPRAQAKLFLASIEEGVRNYFRMMQEHNNAARAHGVGIPNGEPVAEQEDTGEVHDPATGDVGTDVDSGGPISIH